MNTKTLISSLLLTNLILCRADIDETLLSDIFPQESEACLTYYKRNSPNDTFNFLFDHNNIINNNASLSDNTSWNKRNAKYEPNDFLAQLENISTHPNHSWKLRVGKSGNLYSFRLAAFGEAIPPQSVENSPFVDNVFELVGVDQEKNRDKSNGKHPYFIHQAGTYLHDDLLDKRPFYSPTIARHCSDRSCMFATWGQQAHIPTIWRSDVLYFNKYTSCGNVIEHTQIVHNINNSTKSSDIGGDIISYINIPWGAIRKSNLQSIFVANKYSQKLERRWPVYGKFFSKKISTKNITI